MLQNKPFYARYRKCGRAKYISHLDMVRVFNRVFRRGNIPVAYSEGFNPHPKISFALPLSVFYESECEIMLFAVSEDVTAEELFNRFKPVMPEGLEIIEVCEGKPEVKKLSYCLYNVYCSLPAEKELEAFLALLHYPSFYGCAQENKKRYKGYRHKRRHYRH